MASIQENAVSFTGTTAQNVSKEPRDGVSGRDSFTAVAAMQMPANKAQHPLPTPPNSISPNLPPHGLAAAHGKSLTKLETLDQVDSDLDLHDQDIASAGLVSLSRDAFNAQSLETQNLGFEAAGNITSALLAKHHLPEILLNHGPLAIRHITGFLTTSVPGFSGIPPSKARRLVDEALKGKSGGGLNGDVQFEKVGWGRWDAKKRGQASRRSHRDGLSPPSSLPNSFSGTAGVPISGPANSYSRTRLGAQNSWADGSEAVFSHDSDEDIMMLEDIADKMSLDGEIDDGSISCDSSSSENEVTDDEDWAAVGAAALRGSSYKATGGFSEDTSSNFLSSNRFYSNSFRSPSTLAKSAPMFVNSIPTRRNKPANINEVMNMGTSGAAGSGFNRYTGGEFSFDGVDGQQEREAVEALMRLRSV